MGQAQRQETEEMIKQRQPSSCQERKQLSLLQRPIIQVDKNFLLRIFNVIPAEPGVSVLSKV